MAEAHKQRARIPPAIIISTRETGENCQSQNFDSSLSELGVLDRAKENGGVLWSAYNASHLLFRDS